MKDERRESVKDNTAQEHATQTTQFQLNNAEPIHHKNAKAVLIALFVVLVGVIAGLSYVLLQTDESVTVPESEQSTQEIQPEQVDEVTKEPETVIRRSDAWYLLETTDFSIRIPDGWTVTAQDNSVVTLDCASETCYDVVEGQQAIVNELIGGRDGLTGLLVTVQSKDYPQEDITQGYTYVGLVGENNRFSRYSFVKENEPTGEFIGEQPKGTQSNILVETLSDGRVAYLSYDVLVGQQDPIAVITEVLDSFMIKGLN